MRELFKNPLLWSLLINVILIFTIVIMSIIWSKHECPKIDVTPYENKTIELEFKIKDYEKKLLVKNAIIDSYNNDQLDSVWSAINRID